MNFVPHGAEPEDHIVAAAQLSPVDSARLTLFMRVSETCEVADIIAYIVRIVDDEWFEIIIVLLFTET